jgi:hypothetical protein
MSKRTLDLCQIDPAKVAKLTFKEQQNIINFVQSHGYGVHLQDEFERFISFFSMLPSNEKHEVAKFDFSDESQIYLPRLLEEDEYRDFWKRVEKAYDRMTAQIEGTATYYGTDMLNTDFLEDHPISIIPFRVPYRYITFFHQMVEAAAYKAK